MPRIYFRNNNRVEFNMRNVCGNGAIMKTNVNSSNSNKHKHLTLDDRFIIQEMLNAKTPFREIARHLGKDPSTISKEVRKRSQLATNNWTVTDESGNILNANCSLLQRPPYVCNGCHKKSRCRLKRYVYRAREAQRTYEAILSESREGIALSKKEFWIMDNALTEGITKGQHIYQICQANNFPMSQSSVYRHIHKGHCSISAMDLPRAVKFRPRKAKPKEYVPQGVKKGRSYSDFKEYIDSHHIDHWVEMDTVIGRIGGKVLLTMIFTNCSFMIGRLMDSKSAQCVTRQFQHLRSLFEGNNLSYTDYFSLILTDNGGEFSNVNGIENNSMGQRVTHLFFCEPMMSCQKPKVEKGHTLLRDICPKGSNFDYLTQEKVDVIFSHMNSTARSIYNGKTPYELFTFIYGEKAATLLGIQKIPSKDVIQSTRLLQQLGVIAF